MGNNLRCCLACVLPCGALDLVRIVHLNGYVEEITGPVTAGEILRSNPNHVLSKPCSQGVVRRILILSPESELKRGSIYFLIPASSVLEKKKSCSSKHNNNNEKISRNKSSSRKSKQSDSTAGNVSDYERHRLPTCDVVSRKKFSGSSRHDRRRSRRVGVWKPHLQSISED